MMSRADPLTFTIVVLLFSDGNIEPKHSEDVFAFVIVIARRVLGESFSFFESFSFLTGFNDFNSWRSSNCSNSIMGMLTQRYASVCDILSLS